MGIALLVVPRIGFVPHLQPDVGLISKLLGDGLHLAAVGGIEGLCGWVEACKERLLAGFVYPAKGAEDRDPVVGAVLVDYFLQGMVPLAVARL